MTRYYELCSLAAKYSKQFHEHATACRAFAAQLIQGYAAFLSCPLEKLEQVQLDRALKPTENKAPLTQRLPLTIDPEGFVHFAWYLRFDEGAYLYGGNELVTFGLRIVGDTVTIREERDFVVEIQNRDSWVVFFEYLYQQSQQGFSVPYGERRSRIGFMESQ
jgi:hypothetical protein